jgi:Domain of unknown function (DUF1707)
MAGPGDGMAAGAGGRGHLRASHADREQVIGTLKAAFVQGMLAKDEFDLRVGQAFAARTYAELAAVTADLPAGLTTAKPPAPARAQGGQPVARPGAVIASATAGYAAVWAYVLFLSPHGGDNPATPPLILLGGWTYFVVLLICVGRIAALRREQRSGGQPPQPPAPGAGGQASQRLPSADPGRQLPPGQHGREHTTEAAPRRLPRPALPVRGHRGEGAPAAGAAAASR